MTDKPLRRSPDIRPPREESWINVAALKAVCDICGKARSKGSHDRCSRQRQKAALAAKARREAQPV